MPPAPVPMPAAVDPGVVIAGAFCAAGTVVTWLVHGRGPSRRARELEAALAAAGVRAEPTDASGRRELLVPVPPREFARALQRHGVSLPDCPPPRWSENALDLQGNPRRFFNPNQLRASDFSHARLEWREATPGSTRVTRTAAWQGYGRLLGMIVLFTSAAGTAVAFGHAAPVDAAIILTLMQLFGAGYCVIHHRGLRTETGRSLDALVLAAVRQARDDRPDA